MLEKRKRIKVPYIVLAISAIFLALSLALTFTGAWFSDSASGSTNVEFGYIDLQETSVTVTKSVNGKLLPGDKITVANVHYRGEEAYCKISIQVTGLPNGANIQGKTIIGKIAASENYTEINLSGLEMPIPEELEAGQGSTGTISVSIDVIQVRNLSLTGLNTAWSTNLTVLPTATLASAISAA